MVTNSSRAIFYSLTNTHTHKPTHKQAHEYGLYKQEKVILLDEAASWEPKDLDSVTTLLYASTWNLFMYSSALKFSKGEQF